MNITRKDTPAPFAHTPQSPPRTPRGNSKRASRTHKSPREKYLDNLADGNARGGDNDQPRDERISHDLSLTANTGRNSVVDNMLLSLNPDQPKLESPPYARSSPFNSSDSPQSRGHAPSSSLNSDYSFPSSQGLSRPSAPFPRSRRSDSSNFQSLSRINSLQVSEDTAETKRSRAYQSQRAGVLARAAAPASRGGRRSNKSSGSSSVDFGHMMKHSAIGRRSLSYDGGHTKPGLPVPGSVSQPILYNSLEAAPTPTIPSGPRSPAVLPQVAAPSNATSKNGNRVFRTQGKKNKDEASKPIQAGTDTNRDTQRMPIPSFLNPRPDSPLRNREGSMAPLHRRLSLSKDQTKERPGFFRRVFGSSRSAATGHSEPRPQKLAIPDTVAENRKAGGTPFSRTFGSSAGNTQARTAKENQPPPLVKKPSSFFRRRKKSVSESGRPTVLVPSLQPDVGQPESDLLADRRVRHTPSVSSLRELMNPYLSNTVQPRQTAVGTLHTGKPYTAKVPSENAKVKAVFPQDDPPEPTDRNNEIDNSTMDMPNTSLDDKLGDSLLHPTHQSFLHDSSSQETRLNDVDSTHNGATDPPFQEQPSNTTAAADEPDSGSTQAHATSDARSTGSLQQIKDSARTTKAPGSRGSRTSRSRASSFETSKARETCTVQATIKLEPLGALEDSTAPRVWLRSEKSEEKLRKPAESLPQRNGPQSPISPTSPVSDYYSASSRRQTIDTSIADGVLETSTEVKAETTNSDLDTTQPSDDDRTLAKRIYDGDETVVVNTKVAAWLGEIEPDRARVRRAYMELFEWQNLNVLAALRDLCGRLLLKGETQQVDRILGAFSRQWCACNPNHGFKATDVVHTICYSILLLNTDLHVAEIEQKMTRTQFIKNTLPTIHRVAADAAPDGFESRRASTLPARNWAESPSGRGSSPAYHRSSSEGRRSYEGRRPSYRLSSRPSDQATHVISQSPSRIEQDTPTDDCGPLVKAPFHGKMSAWEGQVEIVLKDFYHSVRQQRLPLHRSEPIEPTDPPPPANSSLSLMTSSMLRRTPSMLSKTGSENVISRGRSSEPRLGTGRWTSKTRSRPRLYPSSTVGSSRTSLEDQSSAVWTPSASSTWSKYSLGKTQTSMSINSTASGFPQADYQQSVGFANALSQAIIREEGVDLSEETLRAAPLLEDESLELAGAPWAKEGILKHKHHLEAMDKRAKDRNWIETFAVIEKGYMRLFSFSMNAKSLRQKAKNQKLAAGGGGVVGGGNWMDSAEDLGRFLLRQTIASALPPPGYSKTRPHVWALSLPNGAVHLFQVGTPEIVKEFVTTANYWSARLSKEPLVGGISNVEYGWSDAVINSALILQNSGSSNNNHNISENRPPSIAIAPRPSLQSSIRSSLDHGLTSPSMGSFRPKLPADKLNISDWQPPAPTLSTSVLLECDQLKALTTYVANIEAEL
ncbi:MAG: hypothetical protein Q9190_001340, partial [Brigantiaea leucoxantha]